MTDQQFNQEFDRGGDVSQGEIDSELAREAWLEASDIAYENWRDMQAEKIFNRT